MSKQPTTPSDHLGATKRERTRPSATDLSTEEMAFFEEAMALSNHTPEEEAAFAEYLRKHGGGTGDE